MATTKPNTTGNKPVKMTTTKQEEVSDLICAIHINGRQAGFVNVSLSDQLSNDVAGKITDGIIRHVSKKTFGKGAVRISNHMRASDEMPELSAMNLDSVM